VVAGPALTAFLAVALLGIVIGRLHVASAGSIKWQGVTQVFIPVTFGPHLASTGGRLYMVDKGTATQVWSSADGMTWSQMSDPATFDNDFEPKGISDDGAGGLVIVGEDLVGDPRSPRQTPTIWHSSDGRTFVPAKVEVSTGTEIASVAARPGQMVALGGHPAPSSASGRVEGPIDSTLDAWYSGDGTTWSHVDLPEATGYRALAVTAWKGGFAAVADASLGQNPAVWTSVDGRSWQKSPAVLTGFAPTSIVAFKDRVIVLGAGSDGTDGASWSSVDGRNWVESTALARDPGTYIDAAAVVGDTLVAIGSSHLVDPMIIGAGEPPMPGSENVWLSKDGITWQLLPADSSLPPMSQTDSCLGASGSRVVIITVNPIRTALFVRLGDISGE